ERIAREARFTSDVSHELRSPLTTLNTSLEVLETHSGELSSRASQALALIATELRRFGRMVTDLLEMSRVDSGAAELSTEEVAVGELVVHLATSSGAGVPAVLDPAVADRRVRVDKRRMERVAANLVDNAAQYAGGVTRFAAEHSAGRVRLVVADRGPGVAEEDRSRIFERFYRGTLSGRRGETQGSGLGLSLVAEHVKMHGGRVFVEARDGENRFVVELPLADEPLRAANDNADNAPSGREVPRR
ncbi:MAG: HAMP domain-containing histidine kinase, partial [Actinobacteria bacterium]|nr:HAMP domain-containing histidine kinase [Actinomycetota bacterium]